MVNAGVSCAFRGVATREIPNAGGYMRPIHIHAPVGTIVNPVLPAACGARGVVGYPRSAPGQGAPRGGGAGRGGGCAAGGGVGSRVDDGVRGALAQVVPEGVIAPGEGGPSLIAIGGYEGGRPF